MHARGVEPSCGCRKLVRTRDLRLWPSGGHGLRDLRNCAINPNRPVGAFEHLSRPPDGLNRDRTVSQYSRLLRSARSSGLQRARQRAHRDGSDQVRNACSAHTHEFSAPTGRVVDRVGRDRRRTRVSAPRHLRRGSLVLQRGPVRDRSLGEQRPGRPAADDHARSLTSRRGHEQQSPAHREADSRRVIACARCDVVRAGSGGVCVCPFRAW
jgi:hypothetical protein